MATDSVKTEVGSYFISNYPPFSQWSKDNLPAVKAAMAAPPADVPLGLYLHIPFCRKRCKFCYFKVFTDNKASEIEEYVSALSTEIELVSMVARENRLRNALAELDEMDFDYVFIDCPPSLGLLTINALVAAPEVLIPIQCEYYALEGVSQLMKNIEMVKAHLNPRLSVTTVVLTMYDGRTKLADQVASEVRRFFGDKVLRTVIPRSVKVSEAPGYSMTIIDYDPGSRGAMSYLDASRELAHRPA